MEQLKYLTEESIHSFWKKNQIYEKLMRRKGKNFFLLDGPPYANFIPHVGHIKNTVFKDLLIRMNFMKGFNVLFQPGFDTHGLPVENMVEKKLNFAGKKDIEKFGIANFMTECKANAALNKDIWMDVYKKLGSVYFLKEPYLTYDNSYIESAWWAFAEMYKKGLVYRGEKPVMWCPHCETSLAGYEVTDSYKDVQDPGVYVLFKLRGEDSYLLVYTTTPWTLPGNVAIAVVPEEDYAKVEVNGKKIIIGEKRLGKFSDMGFGYSVIEKFKGKKLAGKKYEPLLDVPLQRKLASGKLGKALEIIASIAILKERIASKVRAKKAITGRDVFEEFVTMADGTGLVHVAPGHGKTDNVVGQHYKLACVSPVDEQCNLTEESGFSGFVKNADKEIMAKLESEGKLLFKEIITHSYPLCWRCKSPLIFRLSEQLFFRIDKVKRTIQKENEKVEWFPEFAREKFDNWVENAEDWNISRQRYWGIPIPIWKCECGEERVIGSKSELEKLSGKKIEDLHSVETLSFKCKCGKTMKKVRGILDVWFDSGVAPWASLGYPQKNKELFESHFPVNRINEAQDQIRGWFYSLMFCSAAVFGKAPYKAVSMAGWVIDKHGNKMSKSRGNVINAEDGLKELGADVLRYYCCWDVAPYEVQKFNMEIAKKEIGRILMVLSNLQNLAGGEKLTKTLNLEDRWIISRLNSMIKSYEDNVDNFEMHTATREIGDFILNDLSRTYIQMTREKENGAVVALCLESLLRLLAPVTPFITERLWQSLREKGVVKEESVHLASWPKFEKKKIDLELEEEMKKVFEIIEKGLFERDKAKVGLKWPLAQAVIYGKEEISEEFEDIIMRQLNVKEVKFENDKETKIMLDLTMTPALEAEGYSRELARKIQTERKLAGLKKGEMINLKVSCDEKIKKMFEANLEFLKERTNSRKIEFVSGKLKVEFEIKEKKIGIEF